MGEKRQLDEKLRSMFWNAELRRLDRTRIYYRKVEGLCLDIQRQHGLQSEPRRIWLKEAPPNLTDAMMKMIEGYRTALICELADTAPAPLPSDILPMLMKLVPETHLAAVLVALRAAAQHLHEEDDMPAMHVIRFFAKLQDGGHRG